jgi:uncharacterized protein YkwD
VDLPGPPRRGALLSSRRLTSLCVVAIGAFALGLAGYHLVPASASRATVEWSASPPEKLDLHPTTLPTTTSAPTTVPEPPPDTAAPPPAPPRRAAPTASSPSITPLGGSEASQLVSLVNRYRTSHGLGALTVASDGTAKAQQHSNDMAAQGRIFHSSSLSSGISGGWSELAENVGTGQSISQIESMFEASSPHRANLLNGDFTQIGVGVTRGGDGNLYVTEFFIAR